MKKITFQIISIFLVLLVSIIPSGYSYVCDDSNNILTTNLPCEGITPASMSCSSDASIINLANYSDNRSNPMFLKIPASSQYNFTFDYNSSGQYLVTLCSNITAIITVTSNITVPPTPPSGGGGGGLSWQAPGVSGSGYNVTENVTVTLPPAVCDSACKANNVVNNLGNYIMPSSPRVGFIIELLFLGGIGFMVYRVTNKKYRKAVPKAGEDYDPDK